MNPYRTFPARQFWSRAVSRGYDPRSIADMPGPLIGPQDKVISAGSCFAANLVPYLESNGLSYLRTETRHPVFAGLPGDNYSYDKFSAAYGNVYTVRQMLQLIQRARGEFAPAEDCWQVEDRFIDPFRPGLLYPSRSRIEFRLLRQQHLTAVRAALRGCSVFIFTLGLTEAWVSVRDGAVYPACPGTIAGAFDADRHAFHNFTVNEVIDDLDAMIVAFRAINRRAKIILTVSPVPLVATATNHHVVAATTYSKSVLRVAAEHGTRHEGVVYFPSYEIVTSPAAADGFFEPDRRNVSTQAVDTVMDAFLSLCETGERPPIERAPNNDVAAQLSTMVAEFECEEAAQDAA